MALIAEYRDIYLALLGAGAAFVASWFYYQLAARDLIAETARLRHQNDLVLYCLTNPNAKVEAKRDASGNVTGLIVSATGSA